DLFKPLKVSRNAFRKIYKCTREIQTLKAEDIYCIEGETLVDKLSLLLSGRLAVLKNGKTMHLIDAHQFIDSPEWFGVGSNDTYQVTIMALEECRVIIWHRDKLKLSIADEPYLQAVMDNILGKDVVKKLLFVTGTVGNNMTSNCGLNVNEHSKLIVPYHKAMDQVIKRNINPEANGVHCFWSLSKINEDTETNV
ncbi:popeye domain-containing protein 3-like protein, partial [Leptotrombidium deliense]